MCRTSPAAITDRLETKESVQNRLFTGGASVSVALVPPVSNCLVVGGRSPYLLAMAALELVRFSAHTVEGSNDFFARNPPFLSLVPHVPCYPHLPKGGSTYKRASDTPIDVK